MGDTDSASGGSQNSKASSRRKDRTRSAAGSQPMEGIDLEPPPKGHRRKQRGSGRGSDYGVYADSDMGALLDSKLGSLVDKLQSNSAREAAETRRQFKEQLGEFMEHTSGRLDSMQDQICGVQNDVTDVRNAQQEDRLRIAKLEKALADATRQPPRKTTAPLSQYDRPARRHVASINTHGGKRVPKQSIHKVLSALLVDNKYDGK